MSGPDTRVCDREWVIFMNARRICNRRYQRGRNWVLASEVFGLGSTYSFALCRRIGVDPEAKVSTRVTPSARTTLAQAANDGGGA